MKRVARITEKNIAFRLKTFRTPMCTIKHCRSVVTVNYVNWREYTLARGTSGDNHWRRNFSYEWQSTPMERTAGWEIIFQNEPELELPQNVSSMGLRH